MAFALKQLSTKTEVDSVIRSTFDKVLVLRFGRSTDMACMQVDDILEKAQDKISRMADVYTVEVEKVPIYAHYFDISFIPATIFFFNAQHIKVDYGTPDHTKFIGPFKKTQDFIDLVEVILRGALHGKVMVSSPIDPRDVPKYDLVYKNI